MLTNVIVWKVIGFINDLMRRLYSIVAFIFMMVWTAVVFVIVLIRRLYRVAVIMGILVGLICIWIVVDGVIKEDFMNAFIKFLWMYGVFNAILLSSMLFKDRDDS
jgi:hypothetical protein